MAVSIDYDLCEHSGTCAAVCPEDVFEYDEGRTTVVRPEKCTLCWICVENCAAGAIEID
jgi:NAD-dependent dihydropyrimidine dehydrogenase PreA subunit